MNQMDVFFRAFTEYRKQTTEDAKSNKFRGVIRTSSADADKLETIRSHCVIDEAWVNRIYEGLPFVEKAIREERQFIRQEGEVIPIERTKRVSKDSVVHLAHHSNLITRVPEEGQDVIPEKLYVVEKLSDFAVYENRFLYMLLCYLRDFIEIRYTKIIELGNSYRASMSMKKEIRYGKRRISYQVNFSEDAKNDPYAEAVTEYDALMVKVEEERHIVAALLLTPLMREVAKSPILKPPITRTNAMRMDNNFKNALALYDYLAAYQGEGYTIETIKKTHNPFPEEMGDEFAELVAMTSFLVYEYGKDMKAHLREAYDAEEEARKLEEEKRRAARLKEMKKRIAETGKGVEEYILLLEKHNASLEEKKQALERAEEAIISLGSVIEGLKVRQEELLGETAVLRDEANALTENLHAQEDAYEQQIAEQKKEHRAALEEHRRSAEEEKKAVCAEHAESMRLQKEEYESMLDEERKERASVEEEREQLRTEGVRLSAELHAQKTINGSIVEEGDFTSKARFEELEKEYAALGNLLNREWKKTKKAIRKRVLWNKDDGTAAKAAEESVVTPESGEGNVKAKPEEAVVPETLSAPETNETIQPVEKTAETPDKTPENK